MSVQIHLVHNKTFHWQQQGEYTVKGFGFDNIGHYYSPQQIQGYFAGTELRDLPDRLKGFNGHYALVLDTEGSLTLAVDRIRSIPLFYGLKGDDILVSDSADYIRKEVGLNEMSELNAEMLRSVTFVQGRETLLDGLYQLEAGQHIVIDKNSQDVHFRGHHSLMREIPETVEPFIHYYPALSAAVENTFNRTITSMEGRTAIVPLSGGYDSRLVAAMLKKLNYEKVICFTYGREDGYEVQISKQVAEKLGFEWHCVPYNQETLLPFIKEFGADYRAYASNWSSLPHDQDIIALKYLLDQQLIPQDGILLPGYFGDFMGGRNIPFEYEWKQYRFTPRSLAQFIYDHNFRYDGRPEWKEQVIESIYWQVKNATITNRDEFISTNENWIAKNRLGKYIVNAIRAYEYLGMEWRLPFLDKELMKVLFAIPNEHRQDKALYDTFLFDTIFTPMGIDYKPVKKDDLFKHDNLLTKMKAAAPKWLKQGVKSVVFNQKDLDINNLHSLNELYYKELDNKEHVSSNSPINYLHGCWYIEQLKKSL